MSYLQNNRSSLGSFEEDAGSSVGDEETTFTPQEAYEIEKPSSGYPYADGQEENYGSATAKFWTRKRNLITAVSSIALVIVAAAVGVVVSRKSSPANQQSLTQDVVITDDVGESPPSTTGDTAELVAVEPAAELISTEILDDGIIYDFVAQQEVTVEEPDFDLDIVEFKGDLTEFIDADVARFSIDADDESCNKEGARWEFTYTTDSFPWETRWKLYLGDQVWVHGPPAKTAYNRLTNYRGELCLPPGDYKMEISDKQGDGFCCEYGKGGYKIKVGDAVIAESDTENNDHFEKRTFDFTILSKQATTTSTVASSTTTTITPTTTNVATTTVATDESATTPSTQGTTQDPTESPSSEPTVTPTQSPSVSSSLEPTHMPTVELTQVPTPEPTNKPTPELVIFSDATNCVNVTIEILTDSHGFHTGYTFQGGDNVIKKRDTGSMASGQKYLDEVCVTPGTYELTVSDSKGNGLQNPGYVAVYLGDEKILHDYTFNKQSKSYTIRAGFNPNEFMNDIDHEWLDGHNERRREFHEANGKEFHPVTWSPKLAQDASVWAEKIITDGCAVSREQNLSLGELTFAMVSGNEDAVLAKPESVMNRWYDSKIKNDPELVPDSVVPGLAFTQVTWLATRYIGCSKKSSQLSDEKYCHVVICRYVVLYSYVKFSLACSPLTYPELSLHPLQVCSCRELQCGHGTKPMERTNSSREVHL